MQRSRINAVDLHASTARDAAAIATAAAPAVAGELGGMLMCRRRHARALQLLRDLSILLRALRRRHQDVEENAGIGATQLWTLSELAISPGLKASELADRLAIHRSTASNMIKDLEAGGLLRRSRKRDNRREVHLYLTPPGRQALRKALSPGAGRLRDTLLDIPLARLDALGTELQALAHLLLRHEP